MTAVSSRREVSASPAASLRPAGRYRGKRPAMAGEPQRKRRNGFVAANAASRPGIWLAAAYCGRKLAPEEQEVRAFIQEHKSKMGRVFADVLSNEPLAEEIASLESQLAAISRQLENPPADPGKVLRLGQDYQRVQQSLEQHIEEWAQASEG